jgi:hypothetical protein
MRDVRWDIIDAAQDVCDECVLGAFMISQCPARCPYAGVIYRELKGENVIPSCYTNFKRTTEKEN